ncbi:hypothetical protein GL213_14315 [Halogeometricum borinquense]|uniref:Uncharacterized protein n=1 Tax=Halogeometricum borinquense (strain ATCC 700274 / DSM 11551 / JCM 10706 / KCTC 4070 / PR3) TaxID=469382 RepID=E4NLX7_HALBP|nr:hypothetical protein [Halogeometricum borinquense]ADQ68427.1 hypothetical protein Hbor_28870 [Halogeometricum borinquense DSM 11551]ELY31389.1 hypothetical protein C499_01335 [Halogeometricum borinquense DSM 11551]QIQ77594.1 hypothetical protein GL213_14315 [Halogeometricum borinquense]
MKIPTNPNDDSAVKPAYQYIEYESGDNTVAVIQDCENESAWVQSTISEPVTQ